MHIDNSKIATIIDQLRVFL